MAQPSLVEFLRTQKAPQSFNVTMPEEEPLPTMGPPTQTQQSIQSMADRGVVPTGPNSFGRPELMPQPLPEGATAEIDFSRPSIPLSPPEAQGVRNVETLEGGGTPEGWVGRNVGRGSIQVPEELAAQTAPRTAITAPTSQGGVPLDVFLNEGPRTTTDAQGRMIDPNADRSFYDQESARREARIDANLGTPRGPDSRGLSERDAEGLTQGDRRNILREQGVGGSAQVAMAKQMGAQTNAAAQDDRSPEQIEQERLENERLEQIIQKGRQPDATQYEKKAAQLELGIRNGSITRAQANEALKRELLGNPPSGYNTWSEYEKTTGVDADGDGKIGSEGEADSDAQDDGSNQPASTDIPTVNTQEEYDALPSGATYVDSQGNRATKR